MFDQTFVNGRQDAKKPATIILSLLIQIAVMCLLMLIPLIYSESLPSAQLKSVLVAPPAPPPVPMARVVHVKRNSRITVNRFVVPRLLAPTTIPRQVNHIEDASPALELTGSTNEGNGPGELVSNVIGPTPSNVPPLAAPKSKGPSGPLRVGGRVAQANLIERVQPVYPTLAKSARIQGSVEFTATISKEGAIENVQLLRGHPLLVNAAREAVSKWRYRPTLLNGQPVEVITDIVVNFTLNP